MTHTVQVQKYITHSEEDKRSTIAHMSSSGVYWVDQSSHTVGFGGWSDWITELMRVEAQCACDAQVVFDFAPDLPLSEVLMSIDRVKKLK